MNAANESSAPRPGEDAAKTVVQKLFEALDAICELDPGSNRPQDRSEVCEAVDSARYLLQCIGKSLSLWNESPAPKDRPIVAIGKIMVEDDFSTTAFPFCHAMEWREADGGDWYFYHFEDHPLTLRRALDEKVIIHSWVEYPTKKLAAETAALPEKAVGR